MTRDWHSQQQRLPRKKYEHLRARKRVFRVKNTLFEQSFSLRAAFVCLTCVEDHVDCTLATHREFHSRFLQKLTTVLSLANYSLRESQPLDFGCLFALVRSHNHLKKIIFDILQQFEFSFIK